MVWHASYLTKIPFKLSSLNTLRNEVDIHRTQWLSILKLVCFYSCSLHTWRSMVITSHHVLCTLMQWCATVCSYSASISAESTGTLGKLVAYMYPCLLWNSGKKQQYPSLTPIYLVMYACMGPSYVHEAWIILQFWKLISKAKITLVSGWSSGAGLGG